MYTKEALAQVEQIFCCIQSCFISLPAEDYYPGVDESPLLGLAGHRKFQILIGILQWLVTIEKPDFSHNLATLNKFKAWPHKKYLDLVVCILEYLR